MKKIFRAMTFFLLISILISLLGACGTNSVSEETAKQSADTATGSTQTKEEPLVVNYLPMHTVLTLPEKDNFMHQWLLENKNIDIQLVGVGDSDGSRATDKMNMLLASGDIPDVVNVLTSDVNNEIVNKWADAGYIISVDDLLSKYPDLEKLGDEKYNKIVYGNKKDGKMYMIPGNPGANKDIMNANVGPIIREDWLKKIGKEVPKTIEELYEVLKAFKEKIPDVNGKKIIPVSFTWSRQLFGYTWTTNWYTLSSDNQKLDWYFTNPELSGYMTYMNKLSRESLLDKEMLTQKDDQFIAKLNEGRVGFTIAIDSWMNDANKLLKASNPEARFIPCPLIRVDGKPLPVLQASSPTMFSALVISKKFAANTRNVERLMEFLNWNVSEEGSFILNNGPEGQFYQKNAQGLFEEKPEVKAERASANNTFNQKNGLGFCYNLMMFPEYPKRTVSALTEEMQTAQTVWKENMPENNVYFDMAGTGSLWNEKWGKMWEELPKWEAKAIYAKSEEECQKAVQEMFKTYETNGGRDIANEKLKLYNDFLAKIK